MTQPYHRAAHPLEEYLQEGVIVSLIVKGVQVVGKVQEIRGPVVALDLDPWGVLAHAEDRGEELVAETRVPLSRTPRTAAIMLPAIDGITLFPRE